MPSTGFILAGTGANNAGAGDDAWSNPGNITNTNDSNYAEAAVSKSETSQYLHGTNYGFSIPEGATIDGIEARFRRGANITGSSVADMKEHTIQLIVGGSRSGDNKADTGANWPGLSNTPSNKDFGGSSDKWGLSLARSDVVASTFGVAVRTSNTNSSSTRNFRIYSVWINVHYTEAAAGNTGAFFALLSVKERLREILKPTRKFWLPDPVFA